MNALAGLLTAIRYAQYTDRVTAWNRHPRSRARYLIARTPWDYAIHYDRRFLTIAKSLPAAHAAIHAHMNRATDA